MNKEQKYKRFLPQLAALVNVGEEEMSVLANVAAALHAEFGWFWTGFYCVRGDRLHLGPFQGSVACYAIPFGDGVCGAAWERKESIVVPDVEEFPGHIACSSLSRSEIVVPLFKEGEVCAVLDIDSTEMGTFDEIDKMYLEQAMQLVSRKLYC